jgi:hypothetical protein
MRWRSICNLKKFAVAIIPLMLSADFAAAAPDLSVGTEFRSYPLSGVVESELGYNFLLWGSPSESPWYGYVRPVVYCDTSISYNTLGAALDVYPISFLRFRMGENGIQNDVDYKAYDCTTDDCRGRYERKYAQVQLSLGDAGFFAQGRVQWEDWTQRNSGTVDFVEPENGLALSPSGDSEIVYRVIGGYKLSSRLKASAGLIYAQSSQTNESSRFPFGLAIYTSGALTVGGGVGVFSSDIKSAGISGLFFLSWQVLPGLELN